LKLAGLSLNDMAVIELNEAFAAQSLAVIQQAKLDAARVILTAAPSPSATPSAAPAQNLPPPSSVNCSAATPAMAWSPCASAAAWALPASSSASDRVGLGLGMLVLFILAASILVFRGLGFAGISALASWPAAVRDGLAVMLLSPRVRISRQ